MKNSRKGFTLVELLIVIVVIGILSAMMMLSSTESVASAKANNIISNLRNLKTAVTAWYADNLDKVKKDGDTWKIDGKNVSAFVEDNGKTEILKYLNNENSITLGNKGDTTDGHYLLVSGPSSKTWYVCYNLGSSEQRVKDKLTSKAKSIGLLGADKGNVDFSDYSGKAMVAMLVLTLEE